MLPLLFLEKIVFGIVPGVYMKKIPEVTEKSG